MAMISAPMLALGLSWMAWTAFLALTVWPCSISIVAIGFAMITIFDSTYQCLVDVYEVHAASVLVGCMFVRFLLAGSFIEVLIDEVLAGVPFSLEFLEKPSRTSARFLVWPLASIGASELCPTPAKEFVINRLRALGERHYLDQANEAATMLEEGGPIEDW